MEIVIVRIFNKRKAVVFGTLGSKAPHTIGTQKDFICEIKMISRVIPFKMNTLQINMYLLTTEIAERFYIELGDLNH